MMNKEKIKKQIRTYVHSIPFELGDFGMAQHPIITSFATIDTKTKALVKIDDNNFDEILEQRLIMIDEAVDKLKDDDDLFGVFIQIHKPFRIPVLIAIIDEISNKQFSEALIDLWVDTEFPHQNGVELMLSLFERADKQYLMDEDEKKSFEDLNDFVVVYRGLQSNAIEKAMSWTIDKKIAIWFATRFDKKGRLIKAKIQKKHIFAFKEGRSEGEIILNPDHLKSPKYVEYEVSKNEI